jgi:hypothetical protein
MAYMLEKNTSQREKSLNLLPDFRAAHAQLLAFLVLPSSFRRPPEAIEETETAVL